MVDDAVHYCTVNVLALAEHRCATARRQDTHLRTRLNVHTDAVNCKEIGEALDCGYVPPPDAVPATDAHTARK
jgi:alanine dehydrogenase